RIERVGSIRRNHVRVVKVEDVAGERDVAGEAKLAQIQGIGVKAAPHLLLAELTGELVVLDDREPELVAFPQEQRSRLGACESAGLGGDLLEGGSEGFLAGLGGPDFPRVF